MIVDPSKAEMIVCGKFARLRVPDIIKAFHRT